MFDNGLQYPNVGVRQNKGRHGAGWGPMPDSRCLQVFVGKTDILETIHSI